MHSTEELSLPEQLLLQTQKHKKCNIGGEDTTCVGDRMFYTCEDERIAYLHSLRLSHTLHCNTISTNSYAKFNPDGSISVQYATGASMNKTHSLQIAAVARSRLQTINAHLQLISGNTVRQSYMRLRVLGDRGDGRYFRVELVKEEKKKKKKKTQGARVLCKQPKRWQKSVTQLFRPPSV